MYNRLQTLRICIDGLTENGTFIFIADEYRSRMGNVSNNSLVIII